MPADPTPTGGFDNDVAQLLGRNTSAVRAALVSELSELGFHSGDATVPTVLDAGSVADL